MNSAQCGIELPDHVGERHFECRPPPDQHVIVPGAKRGGGGKPYHFAQAPPHAVALHGIADLARHGESDPDRSAFLAVFLAVFSTLFGALPCL